MKKYIRNSEGNEYTYQDMIQQLNDLGIDTTIHHYELQAEEYGRYEDGDVYTFKFTAPGDYLAYFAMCFHKNFNKSNILSYMKEYNEYDEVPESLEDMADHASSLWWGDGDDLIIYLKNLDTGEYLYGSEHESEDYESEEDW